MSASAGPPLLVVSDPVGVGKTTAGYKVTRILGERGTPTTFVDFDALSETWPTRSEDRFNGLLALANLRDVWRNAAATGSRNLVVAAVVEHRAESDALAAVVGARSVIVAGLRAPIATLQARVRSRELPGDRDWSLERAVELSQQYERDDPAAVVIETEGRAVVDIANDLIALVDWRD